MTLPPHALAATPSAQAAFDREWTLAELIPRAQWPALEHLLGSLLGCAVTLAEHL